MVLEQGELEGFTVAKASEMLCEQCCGDCVRIEQPRCCCAGAVFVSMFILVYDVCIVYTRNFNTCTV